MQYRFGLSQEVRREGKVHQMEFSRGITTEKLRVAGDSDTTGTKITFMPDDQILLKHGGIQI